MRSCISGPMCPAAAQWKLKKETKKDIETEHRLTKIWTSMARKGRWKFDGLQCKDKIYCLALHEGSAGALRERCGIICTLLAELPKGFPVAVCLLSPPPTPEPSYPTSPWGSPAFLEKDRPTVLIPAKAFASENQRHSLLGIVSTCNGNGSMIWQAYSTFNFFYRQNSNLAKLDFLFIIFRSTNCDLGVLASCMEPYLHGEGIYSKETKATPEVATVKEMYL